MTGPELEVKKDGACFDVTTQNGTAETHPRIDPMTGAILAITPDNEKPASEDDKDASEGNELAGIQGARSSLLQAIAVAEAQDDKVLLAENVQEDGALGIELRVADASGKVTEMMVDAAMGNVMPGDRDGGNYEDGESGEQQEG